MAGLADAESFISESGKQLRRTPEVDLCPHTHSHMHEPTLTGIEKKALAVWIAKSHGGPELSNVQKDGGPAVTF